MATGGCIQASCARTGAGGELAPENAVNGDYVALELVEAFSHGDAPWSNLIIEGDNYDALRALRVSHAGKIRCIYIDPPHNTGNRSSVHWHGAGHDLEQ